jgi:cytochrome c-type biogenesis protein CcmH/NrfF
MTAFTQGDPMNQLTTEDALSLLEERAQWCRSNNESDMRNIVHMIAGVRSMIAKGKSREEIIEAFAIEDEDGEDQP